ncbi:MAG: hypothetical protein IPF92_15215 [Myxococcales bacterium]|nr:hypothetical protein [Myxococcales bacterium]MBL0195224.1 hypothetical protein [Myxococcales bacterium]HQY63336.1 hypothetical protein [Polyangiaceae bacterium]
MTSLFSALAIACGFLLGLRVGLTLGRRSAERALAARSSTAAVTRRRP